MAVGVPRCRRELRSIVRLYGFENGSTLRREWRSVEGFILSPLFANGELQLILIGGRVLSSLADSGGIDTGIKSGSELIEHFAELERDSSSEAASINWSDPDTPCHIVLHVYANGVGVFLRGILVPHLGNGFAMTLCSADAVPTALKFEKGHTADYIPVG